MRSPPPATALALLIALARPALASAFAAPNPVAAADATTTTTSTACVATSTSGAYYDLTEDIAVEKDAKSKSSSLNPNSDYAVRGYDYGANFTLNICEPVVKPVTDVIGVKESLWANVSAYYRKDDDVFSLGNSNGELTPRGKELVLKYKGGSPCGQSSRRSSDSLSARSPVRPDAMYRLGDDRDGEPKVETASWNDDDDDDDDSTLRRKSAIVLFTCDRDPTAEGAYVSFIAADDDECSYVFKVKSPHACAGAEPHKPGSLDPGSVFAIILGIAILVYLLGGIAYNRTVNNARGWKQLPNYSMWAGFGSFLSDMIVIAFSSCAQCLPGRGGYHHLVGSGSTATSRGGNWNSRDHDVENRLIDQLDEDWDD